jgi:hypothetical protein
VRSEGHGVDAPQPGRRPKADHGISRNDETQSLHSELHTVTGESIDVHTVQHPTNLA